MSFGGANVFFAVEEVLLLFFYISAGVNNSPVSLIEFYKVIARNLILNTVHFDSVWMTFKSALTISLTQL